jgi:hypothetical protein
MRSEVEIMRVKVFTLSLVIRHVWHELLSTDKCHDVLKGKSLGKILLTMNSNFDRKD